MARKHGTSITRIGEHAQQGRMLDDDLLSDDKKLLQLQKDNTRYRKINEELRRELTELKLKVQKYADDRQHPRQGSVEVANKKNNTPTIAKNIEAKGRSGPAACPISHKQKKQRVDDAGQHEKDQRPYFLQWFNHIQRIYGNSGRENQHAGSTERNVVSAEKHQKDQEALLKIYIDELNEARERVANQRQHATDAEQRMHAAERRERDQILHSDDRINQLQRKLDQATGEIHELRQIILQTNPDKGEPLDGEVKDAFEGVYRDIRMLVRKWCPNVADPRRLYDSPMWVVDHYVNPYWTSAETKSRIRGTIFEIFVATHINDAVFGAGREFDKNLYQFEREMLQSEKCDPLAVAEWRLQTINCLAGVRNSDWFDKPCAYEIRDLLIPAMPDGPDEVKAAEEAIVTLCKKMYALAIRLRQSRSTFEIVTPHIDTTVTKWEEEDFVVERIEGSDGKELDQIEGSRIAYTVFGALVKTHYRDGKRVSLVRAQVVCRR